LITGRPRVLSGIDSYFLGPQLGETGDGVPIYAPDADKFAQPLTPAQSETLLGHSESKDTSWLQTANVTANGNLFQLPAGVTVTRYGSIVNQAQTGYLTPTSLANLSVSYRFVRAGSVSLIVNNVFDTIKTDTSAG
jgi:hypothetical protein